MSLLASAQVSCAQSENMPWALGTCTQPWTSRDVISLAWSDQGAASVPQSSSVPCVLGCFHARAGWTAFRLRLCSTRKSRFAFKVQPLRLEIPRRCCRAGCWAGRLVRHWRFAKWQLLEGLTWPLGLRLKRRARFLETCAVS